MYTIHIDLIDLMIDVLKYINLMGCLSSSEDNLILEINTSSKLSQKLANPTELFEKFAICKEVSRLLSNLTYTSDQASSLSKALI